MNLHMASFDFQSIISSTDRYNFHSHTQFCDGRAPMEEFATAAVESGMRHYGFTPHSPIPFESPCNMSEADVPVFLAEVDRLQREHEGRIKFYKGMEVDYLGPQWGPANPYFKSLGLDYTIGSVHFIPSDEGYVDIDGHYDRFKEKMARYFANDIRHVVETFYAQSMAMVEEGGFDMLGHLDKIGHNAGHFKPGIEEEAWYGRLVDDLIDLVISKRLPIELNTKAWAEHHRLFPAPRYLPRLLEAGITIAVNSDAHYPALIDASRPYALSLLHR